MRILFRTLAICYFIDFGCHFLDLLDLRLKFSEMDLAWRTLTVTLVIADLLAAVGLWREKTWGIIFVIGIATYELISFIGFPETFGNQTFLITFHLITLSTLTFIRIKK